MFPYRLEWPSWQIRMLTRLTFGVEKNWLRYDTLFIGFALLIIQQPGTCNTYRAIEQANSSRAHLDITGIGATACCHGFFVPTSVVDFQKGEKYVYPFTSIMSEMIHLR